MCRLEDAALGQLAEPAAAVQDHVQAHTPAPPTVAPDAQPEPPDTQTKAPKQKEKKEKKEKEKKVRLVGCVCACGAVHCRMLRVTATKPLL